MSTFNRNTVADAFKLLRNDIRDDLIHPTRANWGEHLANELFIDVTKFTIEHFPPALLLRLNTLMDIPGTREPSGREYARALQNFINRRADPWNFFRDEPRYKDAVSPEPGFNAQ